MGDIETKIIYSRHARRRMKLYRISEQHISMLLTEGHREAYSHERFTFTKDMPEFKYPLKVIVQKEGDVYTIITAYPLKRRETKDEGVI